MLRDPHRSENREARQRPARTGVGVLAAAVLLLAAGGPVAYFGFAPAPVYVGDYLIIGPRWMHSSPQHALLREQVDLHDAGDKYLIVQDPDGSTWRMRTVWSGLGLTVMGDKERR